MSDDWEEWFNQSSQIRRYKSTIVNLQETDAEYEIIYPALPTYQLGIESDVDPTILGQLGIANFRLVWRVQDIDSEIGWPESGDVVVINGLQYFLNSLQDHTNMPSVFTLPPHKVASIGQSLIDVP